MLKKKNWRCCFDNFNTHVLLNTLRLKLSKRLALFHFEHLSSPYNNRLSMRMRNINVQHECLT